MIVFTVAVAIPIISLSSVSSIANLLNYFHLLNASICGQHKKRSISPEADTNRPGIAGVELASCSSISNFKS
ncbi:hypothetical protein F2Q69_00019378 [Brassica cretica]|uniref:Secreted protein n=1 Tax=Brassica cretica TaxID=69181 RepID=A0A8S9QHY1_BRACR|nr:hypothetical protein F2Q69_00019378 [Brassica cretica]